MCNKSISNFIRHISFDTWNRNFWVGFYYPTSGHWTGSLSFRRHLGPGGSRELRAGNKNQRGSNGLCQGVIAVITPGQTRGFKHSDSNQIIRPHTGKQITFREQLDHVWSGHLPRYSELEICESCVFDQWSLASLAVSHVVMLVMARRWRHNGGRGRGWGHAEDGD